MAESGIFAFVENYGYWALFLTVFLQEMGVPNPVPTELILIFAGALTVIGPLNLWLTFLTAVAADVIGTTLLFTIFYFFEHVILERLTRWLPINEKLERVKEKILKRGKFGLFLGRLMPYLRGYVSVAAGILNIPYRTFVPIVVGPAILWSGGYVILGHFLGREWETIALALDRYKWVFLAVLVVVLVGWWFWRRWSVKI